MAKGPTLYCLCGSDDIAKHGVAESGKQRWRCNTCGVRTTRVTTDPIKLQTQLKTSDARNNYRFVITSAQNNTPLHDPCFQTVQHFAQDKQAQLLVIPVRYRNPDAFHEGWDSELEWPQSTKPYLLDEDINLNKNLSVMGSVKVTATAANPLAGLESLTDKRSVIIGHPQLRMTMVPTPLRKMAKMMHTTGSISQPNYSRSRDGKRGFYNHRFAALYVEVQGDKFFPRVVEYDEKLGGFYDLDKFYGYDGTITSGHRAKFIVPGDEHVRWQSDQVKRAIYLNDNSICGVLNPEYIARHDVYDHYAASHHSRSDHIEQIEKLYSQDTNVQDEVENAIEHINETTPNDCKNLIISSNHHDHLRKWLNEADPKKDIINAPFYYQLMELVLKARKNDDFREPLQLWAEENGLLKVPTRFVDPNEPLEMSGWDLSQHGHKGANGGRGSISVFAKTSYPMITGHGHTPGIQGSHVRVGTCVLEFPYSQGLSSSMVSLAVGYPNGKVTLINVVKGEWQRKDSF